MNELSEQKLSGQKAEPKRDWKLTALAFHRLLSWLEEGPSSEGRKYLEMRRRLVAYFDRKNCSIPEELADETLNRVARRLEEEGGIESDTPAHYCYIVARFVFMEYLRGLQKDTALLDNIRRQPQASVPESFEAQHESKEKVLDCLEHCTGKLERVSRDLIVRYYTGSAGKKIESRRELARSLGITMNALSIRACRIRDKLETCVKECLAAK